jgi:bacterioferritin-associated ferredoxin
LFEGAIRECVRGGAASVDEVADRCGAGSACGGCRDSIEAIVARESPRPATVPVSRLQSSCPRLAR